MQITCGIMEISHGHTQGMGGLIDPSWLRNDGGEGLDCVLETMNCVFDCPFRIVINGSAVRGYGPYGLAG